LTGINKRIIRVDMDPFDSGYLSVTVGLSAFVAWFKVIFNPVDN